MKLERILTTIDTHTSGGPTRILTGGLPTLPGATVGEKMEYFQSHHDAVRKLLMHEPRGHRDMSGAVITEPSHPDADIGVFFLTAGGYLPACVHSSIGVAKAGLDTGFLQIDPGEPDSTIRLETPAGLLSLIPVKDEGGKVVSLALRAPPAFVQAPSIELPVPGMDTIEVALVYGGVFFALVDVDQRALRDLVLETPIGPENTQEYIALGKRILEAANATCDVAHPENPEVSGIPLVMFYQEVGEGHGRDIVISGSGGVDRSPCGAGTGAKVAYLYTQGRLEEGHDYINDSFLETRFVGRALERATVGPYDGCVPEVRGNAFITGMHRFVLDADDPLEEGFYF